MLRLFIGTIIIGILTFLLIVFISPLIFSESDVVAVVAKLVLNWSNLFFESMPPIIASYIANLDLAMAAFTAALFLTLVTQLIALLGSISVFTSRWIISYLQRDGKNDEALDLPPIDMDSTFKSSATGKNILGRGLDSIDQE